MITAEDIRKAKRNIDRRNAGKIRYVFYIIGLVSGLLIGFLIGLQF